MPRSTSWTCRSDFGRRSWPLHRSTLRLAGFGLLATASGLAATNAAQEARSTSGPAPQVSVKSPVTTAKAPAPTPPTALSEAEVAALRTETAGQLQTISPAASTGVPPAASTAAVTRSPATSATPVPAESATAKQLRELLVERLQLLEEFEKASVAFKKAANPDVSPEQQATEANAELARLQALLAQAEKNPDVLLPPPFHAAGPGARPSVNAEMKDALEAATAELKECKAKLDSLRTEVVNWEGQQNARRAERDKLFQVVAAMKARGVDREEPDGTATASTATRKLARERQVNAEWKSRVEGLRLQAIEAQIALEAKLAGVRELGLQVCHAQVKVAEKTLELMQSRYTSLAEQQERILKEKAAVEENKSRRSQDPLERFRAHRLAELLDLEAQVVRLEQVLATSPPPSLDEQRSLADHAAADFARIKELLDDGRVSRLDAIRLNNDFRRIGPERDRLLRNEMAIAELRLPVSTRTR